MARGARRGGSYFELTTILYLLAVFCAPLLLLATGARAQDQKPLQEATGPIIGIDLGTTYSCVGVMKGGRVEIIPNDQGNRITPSYVAWTDDERLVGDAAKNQFAANPKRTVFDIKRLIGRKFDDKDVKNDIKHFPFKVINNRGQPSVSVEVAGSEKVSSKVSHGPRNNRG